MSEEMQQSTPPSGDNMTTAVSDSYLNTELAAARASLKSTQITGIIIVLFFSVYLIAITSRFMYELEVDNAVTTVTGIVSGHIDDQKQAFIDDIGERVPAMIQQLPDYAIEQIPEFRKVAEAKFDEMITAYAKDTRAQLDGDLNEFFAKHKDAIQNGLDTAKQPEAIKELAPAIKDEVMDYLKAKPASGPSIDEQVDESLKQLKEAQKRLHRLATAKNLTPAEKQTRRAIAVIANTIKAENLQPLEMPTIEMKDNAKDAVDAKDEGEAKE